MLPAAWNRPESSASRAQSLRGAIAASSLRRSSESDTLELQQAALVVDAEAPVVADAVRRHDAMAGQRERRPVVRAERPGGALRVRIAGVASQLPVRDDLAVRHRAERVGDRALERRQAFEVELERVERRPLAGEVPLEGVDESTHNRHVRVTDTSASSRYRRPQREAGLNPTRVGVWPPTRLFWTQAWQLVPDETRSFEPELAFAPPFRRVGDARHRHGPQAYNRRR